MTLELHALTSRLADLIAGHGQPVLIDLVTPLELLPGHTRVCSAVAQVDRPRVYPRPQPFAIERQPSPVLRWRHRRAARAVILSRVALGPE